MTSRRDMLAGIAAAGLAAPTVNAARAATLSPVGASPVSEQTIAVPGGQIYTREIAAPGPAVFLAHPGTGSAHVFDGLMQQLAGAGYRAIAWSRRGHRGSSPRGTGDHNDDLIALADTKGIGTFHLVGSAAGGGFAIGFAAQHGDRLKSLAITCSNSGVADPRIANLNAALMPDPFNKLPAHVRELGPDYRARDPEGTAHWIELEEQARLPSDTPMGPPPKGGRGGVTAGQLAALAMPALWIAGEADLFAPPPLMKIVADQVPGARFETIRAAGHSAYWERPEEFFTVLRGFLDQIAV